MPLPITQNSSMVNYVTPVWGLAGQRYFGCQALAATLTTTACASNWRSSNEPGAERLMPCRSCPIGQAHAGDTDASTSPLRGARVCSRCLAGTMRLINGWLCVSCYNREREYIAGRNAKGRRPTRMATLDRRELKVFEFGVGARTMARALTVGLEEIMAAALRESSHRVVFAFDGHPAARYRQQTLW